MQFGEGLIRGKRTKFALQIVQKALKCPLQYVKFQEFSGGAGMPLNRPKIIFVTLFASNLTLPEKTRLKTSKTGAKKF